VRYFERQKGIWQFCQKRDIFTSCYYHPIFWSKMALGAIINELGEKANIGKDKNGTKGL